MTRRKLYDHPERVPQITGKRPSLTPAEAEFVALVAAIRKHTTNRALAKMLNVSVQTVSNYATGNIPKRYRVKS